MQILVTGGAGYIGSHMVNLLYKLGHRVWILDDLSAGFRDAVLCGEFVEGSLHDKTVLNTLFASNKFDAVIHFAGSIAVGESVRNPAKYYQNNLTGTLNLLDAMRNYSVNKIVFSSTAAIFGMPQYVPIDEKHPQAPINPYGMTKWVAERILQDYSVAYGLRFVALRYFNAAGASPDGTLGERHDPETHLIPLAIRATRSEEQILTVFGTDYDTPDGTCIRDYIHILDLCDAHMLALQHLIIGGESRAYNLGNGKGCSVKNVIEVVEKVSGRKVHVQFGSRRSGDPDRLVANAAKICQDWGWQPKYSDLEQIILHAWQWEESVKIKC